MSEAQLNFFATCAVPHSDRDCIQLGHGSGGRLTSRLIERIILPALHNEALAALDDQAQLALPDGSRLAFTTDSYVVSPRFFPGGDIGELAVNGTINDLAMGGARPLGLSLAFILEEGLPLQEFERIIASIRRAAERARVPVVTGDTKVVDRGSGDGVFINTSGVGLVPERLRLGSSRVCPGDAIIVSGTLGDHGVAILAQRESLSLHGQFRSDTAPLHELSAALLEVCPEVHMLRDPTRGGLGAVLCEIATRRSVGIAIEEATVPVDASVQGACEIFGLDPLLMANEGKLVAFVPEAQAERALEALRSHPLGTRAARVGVVVPEHPGNVVLYNAMGGNRVLDLPLTEPLPRIC